MFRSKFNVLSLFVFVLLLHVGAGVYFNGYNIWTIPAILLSYFILLILGSIFIHWNFYIKSMNKLSHLQVNFNHAGFALTKNVKPIALTFDDGPSEYTSGILDILKQENISATFFIIGQKIKGQEALLSRMAKGGHEIGGHSFYHSKNFDWQSSKAMLQEITDTNTAIESIINQKIRLFRPPYGVTNPNLARAIRQSGMASVGWQIRSMDTIARSEDKLLKKIITKLKPGAIILMHDHCEITFKILPKLIAFAKEKGFQFVTL